MLAGDVALVCEEWCGDDLKAGKCGENPREAMPVLRGFYSRLELAGKLRQLMCDTQLVAALLGEAVGEESYPVVEVPSPHDVLVQSVETVAVPVDVHGGGDDLVGRDLVLDE